jgi:hypothetical protein
MRSPYLTGILILTMIFASSFHVDKSLKGIDDKKSRIEVFFNSGTGFTELVMIKAQLETKGIVMNYKKIEYNKNGELVSIHFFVDCRDGFSGSASTDNLKKVPFGFYRDYSKDAASPFGTGAFNK